MGGYIWLASFFERNPEVSIRQAEGLPLARAKGMNREEVHSFFKMLETDLKEPHILNEPQSIFNVDESDIQLINKPEKL
jgi:hypothetical protein